MTSKSPLNVASRRLPASADPEVKAVKKRLVQGIRRESLIKAVLGFSIATGVAAAVLLHTLSMEDITERGAELQASIDVTYPEQSKAVKPLIDCAVVVERGNVGPIQYLKAAPRARSDALALAALECARKAGPESLARLRTVLFVEHPDGTAAQAAVPQPAASTPKLAASAPVVAASAAQGAPAVVQAAPAVETSAAPQSKK